MSGVSCSSSVLTSKLDKVGNIHGHLVDLCVIMLLDVSHHALVVLCYKVDCHSLPTESAGSTNPMDVVLPVTGKVIIDDKGDLLHINTTSQKISGDEHTAGT